MHLLSMILKKKSLDPNNCNVGSQIQRGSPEACWCYILQFWGSPWGNNEVICPPSQVTLPKIHVYYRSIAAHWIMQNPAMTLNSTYWKALKWQGL